jgi:hypothetical protein
MKNPAVASGDRNCVFYDVGGTALKLYSGGRILELDTNENIISVSMNDAGYFAVSCEESGYKGSVTVFSGSGEAVYKWYSGAGYLLDAAVSPGSDALAVLTLEKSGSVLHMFELKNEAEVGTVYISGELAFTIAFTGSDSFCTLSENALRFYKTNGSELSATAFGDLHLTDYCVSEDICIISLSKYISGSSVTLTSYSGEGRALGSADLNYSPLTIAAGNQRLMVLGSGVATVFNRELSVFSETQVPAGYSKAVYLPDGGALLLSSYHGEKIALK